jgi:hypothetical protein
MQEICSRVAFIVLDWFDDTPHWLTSVPGTVARSSCRKEVFRQQNADLGNWMGLSSIKQTNTSSIKIII